MPETAADPSRSPESTPADNRPASPKPGKKKGGCLKKLFLLAAVLVLLLVLLVVFLPQLLSTGPGRSVIASIVNSQIKGEVEIDRMSLSWWGGIGVGGVTLTDPDGKVVVDGLSVDVPNYTLFDAVRGSNDLGKDAKVTAKRIDIVERPDGTTNLRASFAGLWPRATTPAAAPAAAPPPAPVITLASNPTGAAAAAPAAELPDLRVGLDVAVDQIKYTPANGKAKRLDAATVAVRLLDPASVELRFDARLPGAANEAQSIHIKLDNAFGADRKFDASGASIDAGVAIDQLPIDMLAAVLGMGPEFATAFGDDATGKAGLRGQLDRAAGEVDIVTRHRDRLGDNEVARLTLGLKADRSDLLVGNTADGQPPQITVAYGTREQADALEKLLVPVDEKGERRASIELTGADPDILEVKLRPLERRLAGEEPGSKPFRIGNAIPVLVGGDPAAIRLTGSVSLSRQAGPIVAAIVDLEPQPVAQAVELRLLDLAYLGFNDHAPLLPDDRRKGELDIFAATPTAAAAVSKLPPGTDREKLGTARSYAFRVMENGDGTVTLLTPLVLNLGVNDKTIPVIFGQINPLLATIQSKAAEGVGVEAVATLTLAKGTTLPIDDPDLSKLTGTATFAIDKVRLSPEGWASKLFTALQAGNTIGERDGQFTISVPPTDFRFDQGKVSYTDFAIDIQGKSLTFSGALDLNASQIDNMTIGLGEGWNIRGFDVSSVKIPLTGSLDNPQLDLSGVGTKALLNNLGGLVGGDAGNALDRVGGLLNRGGDGEADSEAGDSEAGDGAGGGVGGRIGEGLRRLGDRGGDEEDQPEQE